MAAEGKLTPEAMQEGSDRLQACLAEVERRRAKFQELRQLARQNHARAQEALTIAAQGLKLQTAAEDEIRAALGDAVHRAREGGAQ